MASSSSKPRQAGPGPRWPALCRRPRRAADRSRRQDRDGPARPAACPGLRLHVLGDAPMTVFTALSPDPARAGKASHGGAGEPRRASLILRRQSRQGEALRTHVREPVRARRAGVPAPPAGRPRLLGRERGRRVSWKRSTDRNTCWSTSSRERPVGFRCPAAATSRSTAWRCGCGKSGLVLAGGTFAEGAGKLVSQASLAGTLSGSVRRRTDRGLGWFVTAGSTCRRSRARGTNADRSARRRHLPVLDARFPRIEPEGTRLHVREETGFTLDPADGSARYYQFPQVTVPGPHRFRLSQIAR